MEKLAVLEQRLELLENLLLSTHPGASTSKDKVLPALANISNKVDAAEKNNISLKRIYNQLDDLEKFASMCHADTLDQPTDAKVEYIEAICAGTAIETEGEKQLKEQAKHMENVEKLKWVLDSEHLKTRVTSDLNVKMLKISETQGKQREVTEESLAHTKELAENYNKALKISAVTRQFEKWNALVTQLEEEQNVIKE